MAPETITLPPTTAPAPLRHAHVVWHLLLANAETQAIPIPLTDEVRDLLVYRGSIGAIYESAKVSKTYYSEIRKILIECGAINILEKGTIHNPSVVVLNPESPPPMELPSNVKSDEENLTAAELAATLLRRVEVLETALGGINLTEALRNVERRLSQLETGE